MSSTETATCLDALLTERTWLRRLASGLLQDAGDAEDLMQETWVTALTSPPRSATRAWLRRVFRSRLCDDSRARQRRHLREQVVIHAAVEKVATPEEITARMELLRRVAGHMLALDDDLRLVLYLRYVEDLEPIEVARRLSIPDGTVRWRIKQGLDELRFRLDADAGGDRKRWLPLLAPLTSAGQPIALPGRPGLSRTTRFVTAAGLMAVGLSFVQWRCPSSRLASTAASEEEPVPPGTVPQPVVAQEREPGPGGVQVDAEAASPCPEAEALEVERDALARATERDRTLPKDTFLKSAPNTAATVAQLTAAVDATIEKAGQCGHTFECRGTACRLSLLIPEAITLVKGWLGPECFDAVGWEGVYPWFHGLPQHEYGGFTFDPVSRTGFRRFDVYYRLANDGAAPRERHPTELPAGWDRDRGPIPANLAPACRARVVRVRNELADIARQISRTMYVNAVFEQSTPRPALAQELAGLLRPHLAAEGKPLPVEIECRGIVCALKPRDDVAGSGISWNCMSGGRPGGTSCWARWNDDGWFAKLLKVHLQLPLENLVPPREYEGQTFPAFVIVRPRDEQQGVSGDWWIRSLVDTLGYAAMVTACERRYPARGSLILMAKVQETCGFAEKPKGPLITMQYEGELMDSALAECLRTTLGEGLARLEPPDCTFAWGHEWGLEFPHPSLELKASD